MVKRHNILHSFFTTVLGIDSEVAKRAACKAEHSLGPQVISRLLAFIEFVGTCEKEGVALTEEFAKYCKAGKHRKKTKTGERI